MDDAKGYPTAWQRFCERMQLLRFRLALGSADRTKAIEALQRLPPLDPTADPQTLLLEEAGRWGRHLREGGVLAAESRAGLLWKGCKLTAPLAAALVLGAVGGFLAVQPISNEAIAEQKPTTSAVATPAPRAGVPLLMKDDAYAQVLVPDSLRSGRDGRVLLPIISTDATQQDEWRNVDDFKGERTIVGTNLCLKTFFAGGDLKHFYLWPTGVPESGSWISKDLASLLVSQMNAHLGAAVNEVPGRHGAIKLSDGEILREYAAGWSGEVYRSSGTDTRDLTGSVVVTGGELWLGVVFKDGNGRNREGWTNRELDWAKSGPNQDLEVLSPRMLRKAPKTGTGGIRNLKKGDILYPRDEARAADGHVWLKVLATCGNNSNCEAWVAFCSSGG